MIRVRLRSAVLRTAPHRTARPKIVILLCLVWGPRYQTNIATDIRESRGILFVVHGMHPPIPRDQFCSSLYPLHVILEGLPSHSCCISREHPLSPCNDRLHLMCCPVFYGNPSSTPLNFSVSHQLMVLVVTIHRFIIHNSKLLSFFICSQSTHLTSS